MAQTKRKRRTKHRGNAAGTIEARGRTGRKPTAEEQQEGRQRPARRARERARTATPPTWNARRSSGRAIAARSCSCCSDRARLQEKRRRRRSASRAFALLLYIPLGYYDRQLALYNAPAVRKPPGASKR